MSLTLNVGTPPLAILLITLGFTFPQKAFARRQWSVIPGKGELSIQEAIDAASNGDEVVVYPGTYEEALNLRGKSIHLRGIGGPAVTVFEGASLNSALITCNSQEGPATVIEGFTFQHGRGSSPFPPSRWGGAIFCENSSPTIRDNLFFENGDGTVWAGAVLYSALNSAPQAVIERNVFMSNRTRENGGAVMVEGPCIVRNNLFENNSTQDGDGAGLYVFASRSVEIEGNVFRTNSSGDHGGGVFFNNIGLRHQSPIELQCRGNVFVGNHSQTRLASDCSGSAVWIYGGAVVTNNTFLLNSATTVGAVLPGTICVIDPELGTHISQNVVAFNQGGGISFFSWGHNEFPRGVLVANNVLFSNDGSDIGEISAYKLDTSENLVSDPLICDLSEASSGELAIESPAFQHWEEPIGAVLTPGCSIRVAVVQSRTWSSIKLMHGPSESYLVIKP